MQTGCSIRFQRQVEKSGTFARLISRRLITNLWRCTMRCCVRLPGLAASCLMVPRTHAQYSPAVHCCIVFGCRLPRCSRAKETMTLSKSKAARQPRFFRDAKREGSGVLTYLRAALRGWIEGLLETIHKNQNLLSHRINRTGVPIESLAQLR